MGQVLTFDEATHTYRVDGRVVKSVTQILHDVFPNVYANIPAAILERKSKLGIATHRVIELFLLGTLDESTIHPEVRPYFDSWLEWFEGTGIVDGEYTPESQFYSSLGYPGTIDFEYALDHHGKKGWGVIDWKITNNVMPTHPIQTAAYAVAKDAQQAGCLYLRSDGKPAEYVETDLSKSLPDWFAVLRVFNMMEKMQ